MTWTCPACGVTIRHDTNEPLLSMVYHCHVCSVELIVNLTADGQAGALTLAPWGQAGRAQPPLPRQ